MVLGDILAQVGSNHVGARRLLEFMDEYGMTIPRAAGREVQRRTEAAMRDAIRAVPDGTYRSQVEIQGPGEPITLPCAVIVDGDELTVDWEGAPPAAAGGRAELYVQLYGRAHGLCAEVDPDA